MKILRTMGILALVAGLVLGGAGSAFAKGPPGGPPGGGPHSPGKRGLFGIVDSVDVYVVTLVTKEGSTVEVTLTDTAKYMVPGVTKGPVDRDGFEAILDGDITAIEGRRIAVLVTDFEEYSNTPPPDFTATAIRLMLIPSPDAPPFQMHHRHAHRVGIVDDFDPDNDITIIDKDGVSHSFGVNEDTVYRPDEIAELTGTDLENALANGCVTVVTTGDPKADPPPVAKAIVLHEDLPDWAPEP